MSSVTLFENHNLVPGICINIYKTVESLERIRPAWERLQRHPNADIDFFLTVLKVRPNILRPHIVTLEKEGEIKAMLIGRIEQIELKCSLGYLDLWRPWVRSLTIIHGGVLGEAEGPDAEALVDSLLASLRQGEADVVILNKLAVNQGIFQIARRRPGPLCRDLVTSPTPHWVIDLPSSLDEMLQRFSSKRRNKYGRMERLFERNFPDRIRYRLMERPEDVPTLCRDLEAVARLTYQGGLGSGFLDDEEHRQCLALEASRGQLCALIIYLDDRPCAFQLGTIYRGAYHLIHTGFDPALRHYEVGTLALTKIIDHLCRNGIQRFDFGLGDADYKRKLATTGWQDATVHLFAPALRPVAVNIVRELLVVYAKGLRKASALVGVDQRIKRSWRRYLSRHGGEIQKTA